MERLSLIFVILKNLYSNNKKTLLAFVYISDMKGKIRVFCRLRPLNEKEIYEKERVVLTSLDEFTVEHPWRDDKTKQHIYDHVFDGNATQEDVFEDARASSMEFQLFIFACSLFYNIILLVVRNSLINLNSP